MTLNGTLEDFSPAGILKVLSADARTGAVRFGGPHGCTVYLHRGQLYFARNEGTDQALATALVRPGRLTADDWGRAIDAAGARPMVGELLVRDSAISPDLLASVVLSVIYDPLIDLFRDGTGEFDFEPDTVHWLGPFRAFPVDAIVGEVRKRVREADEWSSTIPGLDAWVEASRTLPGNAAQVTILREDWELVTALSGPRTVRDLATELGRGCYSTARVVNRLEQAGLVEVIATNFEADVVPIRRRDTAAEVPTNIEAEVDPLLAMGLPHRTANSAYDEQGASTNDPLAAHIGDAIATAIAESDAEAETETVPVTPEATRSTSADHLDAVDHDLPSGELAEHRWDESRLVADGGALHHEEHAEISLDEARPGDPNAAWLADLYSQFIDEPESKKRRKTDLNPVDVAFKSDEQDGEARVSTLKRLMGALKKL